MNQNTNERQGPDSGDGADATLAAIDADVDAQIAHLAVSADAVDDDEPGLESLATRLRGLRAATAALEQAFGDDEATPPVTTAVATRSTR